MDSPKSLPQTSFESDNVIHQNNVIHLSDKDRDIFLKILQNPPKPNKRLLQAFKSFLTVSTYPF